MKHSRPLPQPPEGKLCPIIIRLARFCKKDFNRTLSECGLFPGQEHMIITISEEEGITASALAERFHLSLATVSVSVKRMEKAGFICKTADDKDARISHLYLTDKAKAVTSHVQRCCERQEEMITSGMNEAEKQIFLSLLLRAMNNINEEECVHD